VNNELIRTWTEAVMA